MSEAQPQPATDEPAEVAGYGVAGGTTQSTAPALVEQHRDLQPPPRVPGEIHPWRVLTARETFSDLASLCLADLFSLARALADSSVVPKDLIGKAGNVFAVLLKGAELQLSAMTSVCEIQVIKGKLSLSSHLVNALVVRSGKMKVWKLHSTDDERAVYEVQRKEWDAPVLVEFTWKEAKDLGLNYTSNGGKSPWDTQRANMLRRRVITRAAREHAGDVVIAYDPEEIADQVEPDTAPAWGVPATPQAPRHQSRQQEQPAPSMRDLDADIEAMFNSEETEPIAGSNLDECRRDFLDFTAAVAKAQTRAELKAAQKTMERWFTFDDAQIKAVVAAGDPVYKARWKALPR